MGKLWQGRGGGGRGGKDKNLLGEGLLGGFSQVGEGFPQSFPVGKPIYIYHSASQCTNPPSKPQPNNFSVPQGTEKFNKLPEANKKL